MKPIILKINVFILLLTLIGTGCKKDEEDLSYLDYTKSFYIGMPGFAVYKTKKDYFFNVAVRPYENSYQSPELNEESENIILFNGKYYNNARYRLDDNFVVSYGISSDYLFTSLTYDDYIRNKLSPLNNTGNTNPQVINSIIDSNPFTELYYSKDSFDGKAGISISELNQLIKEKNLERYFTKLK